MSAQLPSAAHTASRPQHVRNEHGDETFDITVDVDAGRETVRSALRAEMERGAIRDRVPQRCQGLQRRSRARCSLIRTARIATLCQAT